MQKLKNMFDLNDWTLEAKTSHATLWIYLQKMWSFSLFFPSFALQLNIERRKKKNKIQKNRFRGFASICVRIFDFLCCKEMNEMACSSLDYKYRVRKKYFVFSIEHQHCVLSLFCLFSIQESHGTCGTTVIISCSYEHTILEINKLLTAKDELSKSYFDIIIFFLRFFEKRAKIRNKSYFLWSRPNNQVSWNGESNEIKRNDWYFRYER